MSHRFSPSRWFIFPSLVFGIVSCGKAPPTPLSAVKNSSSEFPLEVQRALDGILADQIRYTGETGITMSLRQGERVWQGAAGVSDIETGRPMDQDMQFRVGSHTKLIVGTIILELVEEGRLRLDTKVAEFLSDYPKWQDITIEQLLGMTSGIPEYFLAPSLWARFAIAPKSVFSPRQILQAVQNSDLEFSPGQKCSYSDTNPIVLGLIIEAITGKSLATVINERIISPLNLRDTFLDGEARKPTKLASAYFNLDFVTSFVGIPNIFSKFLNSNPRLPQGVIDGTHFIHPSLAWAAGAVVSTPHDMGIFIDSLMHETFVSRASLDFMRQAKSCTVLGKVDIKYGHAMFEEKTMYGPQFGHGGFFLGHRTQSYYVPTQNISYSRMSNYFPDQSDFLIDEILQTVVEGPQTGVKSCEPPRGFGDADEEGILTFSFRSRITDPRGTSPQTGIGNFKSLLGGDMQAYLGLSMKANIQDNAQAPQILITAKGPSYAVGLKSRQVDVSLPKDFATKVDTAGYLPLGESDTSVVVRDTVTNILNSRLHRSCVTAVLASAAPSKLLVCDAGNVVTEPGAQLKLFGRAYLERRPAMIKAYLSQHQIPRCQCFDSTGIAQRCS